MYRTFFGERLLALCAASLVFCAAPTQAQPKPLPVPLPAPAASAPQAAVSPSGQRIVEATRQQLLQVRTLLKGQDSQSSVGSGFLVDASGLAITNYHVVSQYALRPERYRLSYTLTSGSSGVVELLAIDVVHDLALVRLQPEAGKALPTVAPLVFRPPERPMAKGERIYALGNPLDVGFAVVEGVYNGLVERSYLPQIFFGGALSGGMSGGPAVDEQGQVIGINVATRRDGQSVSFLVPAQYARELLAQGRGKPLVQQAQHAEVARQVQAHQAELVNRFMALPWRSANHERYRVPVPQEQFMRCWGTPSPASEKYLRFERSDCAMEQAIYINGGLRTGFITVRHEAYDGSKLGTLRFTKKYAESFRNEHFSGGSAATAPQCREAYTEHAGLPMRTVACLTALKRFAGLYNLSVLTTSVDQPTQGVQGRLDAHGVNFANALRLTEHYLQGFGLNPAVKP